MKLSYFLNISPDLYIENTRIKCPLMEINSIGQIDTRFKKIESINLSKNFLSNLSGIEQFSNVKSLDLSFNKVLFFE